MNVIAKDVLTGKSVLISIDAHRCSVAPSDRAPAVGIYLSPGWVDIQVNGFAGVNLSADGLKQEGLLKMNSRLQQEGVSLWLPTLVSAPSRLIQTNLGMLAEAREQEPALKRAIPGVHLEGPYISAEDGARGAHATDYIRPPDWDEFQRWQEAAGGLIRIVTLAPEQPGSIAFIRRAVQSGVVAAIGHTTASASIIREAVDAGASLSTHLGNGIATQIHRHNNPLWDQLADDRLFASLIFDGFHLPANVMRVFFRSKGIERCILVSDAASLAKMPPGIYATPVGGKVRLHEDGRLSMLDSEYLAGSASSLKDCIPVAVRAAGCTLAQAIQMVTVNPGRLLNLPPVQSSTLFRWDSQAGSPEILALIQAQDVTYLGNQFYTENENYPR